MSKYIDAEKLIAEIKGFRNIAREKIDNEDTYYLGMAQGYDNAIVVIESLQQEQPKVDLEKEYKEWWETRVSGNVNIEHTMEWFMHETARHFYELDKNTRKEK